MIPALYNLAAADLLPDKFCVVGIARKGMSSDDLRDSLMKGLRQFATRPVDDAIARRLLECVTCIEADPKDPASFDAMRERLEKLEANARPAATGCSIWRRRPKAFAPISQRTRPHRPAEGEEAARGGGWWSKSRSAPTSPRPRP